MSYHLLEVKQALAEKYAQKARNANSQTLQKRMAGRAKRYRAQVRKIQELLNAGVKNPQP